MEKQIIAVPETNKSYGIKYGSIESNDFESLFKVKIDIDELKNENEYLKIDIGYKEFLSDKEYLEVQKLLKQAGFIISEVFTKNSSLIIDSINHNYERREARKKVMKLIRILDEYTVIVDAGSDVVSKGDYFKIVGEPEEIIDPITQRNLGLFYREKAVIEVVDVYEKICVCKSLNLGLITLDNQRSKLNVEKVEWVSKLIRNLDNVILIGDKKL